MRGLASLIAIPLPWRETPHSFWSRRWQNGRFPPASKMAFTTTETHGLCRRFFDVLLCFWLLKHMDLFPRVRSHTTLPDVTIIFSS
jgi:transposase